MLSRRKLCFLIAATPLFSACGLSSPEGLPWFSFSHPSDQQLERIFNTQKAVFEELISLFEADSKIDRIAFNFTWLMDDLSRSATELGFTEARWNLYRDIFSKLGLKEGLTRPRNPQRIQMIASLISVTIGGTSKGYAYSKTPLEPIFDSLDSIPLEAQGKGYKTIYKKLGGNWYLFLD